MTFANFVRDAPAGVLGEADEQIRKYAKTMRLHYAERGARACRARMSENI